MPKGPRGEKRPADTIGAAIMVARIATGEIVEGQATKRTKSGKAGGKARAAVLSKQRRQEIAKTAAASRWKSS